jgi:hypothetical protein
MYKKIKKPFADTLYVLGVKSCDTYLPSDDEVAQMIKQAQENSNTYAKANPVKIEPSFTQPIQTTSGFNGTSAANITYINGKPAPVQPPHPEI